MLIFLFITCYNTYAQEYKKTDNWMTFVEELAEETEDPEQIEVLFNELSYLSEHPFELNSVEESELRKLPFLSDYLIGQLISYRKRYGHFMSVYELKNIDGFDQQTIALLLPFVAIKEYTFENIPITTHNLLKKGSNELRIRYDQGFQQKKGYQSFPDSILEKYPNRKYLGEPFYHSLHYSYSFDNRIQVGIVAEKDAGEPFMKDVHKGYDYYSFHFFMKDIKWLKSLAIGDYKVSFGQGLVVSNDFSLSRSSIVTQAERRNNGFRRHFSTNEKDFFRGVATTIQLKTVDLSLFYSYRKRDASLDSATFTTIKADGLHRLPIDYSKRGQLAMHTFGGNIRYASSSFSFGITTLFYSFGPYKWTPEQEPYTLYSFRGNKNLNIGFDYIWRRKKFKLFGETAFSRNGGMATLNAFQLTPVSYLSFLILHRYYDKKYQAYFGNAFAQRSTIQNEQGIYLGLQFSPFSYWKISGYADVFRHPWLLHGVDAPSLGKEYMGQIDYTRASDFSAYIRYKYRQKEKNKKVMDSNLTTILPYAQHRLRIQLTYRLLHTIICRSSFDGVLYDDAGDEKRGRGLMLSQNLGWKPVTIPIAADFYLAWFHTDDYNSRISSYEKNILYAFSMPSFYGSGLRFAATMRWKIIDKLTFSVKIAHTLYTDRDIIGTGTESIEGNQKTDFYSVLNWKF